MPELNPAAIIEEFTLSRTLPADFVLRRLLLAYARPDCQLENIHVELKEGFLDDAEAWLNLERQLVAFCNSGGGIIIFGLASDNRRVGLPTTLLASFDPINLTQKLQRHAPQSVIPTAYAEVIQYRKRYGFLLVGRSEAIIVFDKLGEVKVPQGRTKRILIPGVVYVRTEGASREARQADIDRLVNDRTSMGLSAFLARIERVATLPPTSELIARAPSSSRGYVLVSSGQGVPVTIGPADSGVVQLSEVLAPEAPLSSLNAEVVGQLRQWHADPVHRVPRSTLMRWYLGRSTFVPMVDRAEFCFLSALHDWGYPMYWASQMDRDRLEEVLRHQFEIEAYPDNRVLVYVIGAFFFSRRNQILNELQSYLPNQLANIIGRLRDSADARSYLTSGRICAESIRVESKWYELSDLMNNREHKGQALFENLMGYYDEGNVPDDQRGIAHQLDMLVHGDLES
jgi:Putative DNA-binding domain